MQQARHWILTIPHANFTPYLPKGIDYIRGQLECGEGGFLHWQLVCHTAKKLRLGGIRSIFGPAHAEPTRSEAAEEYVWKEDTAITNTRFELGRKPVNRGVGKDWDAIKEAAKSGRLDDIPSDVYVRNYNTIKRICVDNCRPVAVERQVKVYWGATGTGKSHRAWGEAGLESYPKDPRSKFWDGYRDQQHVVIDEFRGNIDISHILRWFDKYPVIVEVKGSSVVLKATRIWITSNISPEAWYPDLDGLTRDALMRRLIVEKIEAREDK